MRGVVSVAVHETSRWVSCDRLAGRPLHQPDQQPPCWARRPAGASRRAAGASRPAGKAGAKPTPLAAIASATLPRAHQADTSLAAGWRWASCSLARCLLTTMAPMNSPMSCGASWPTAGPANCEWLKSPLPACSIPTAAPGWFFKIGAINRDCSHARRYVATDDGLIKCADVRQQLLSEDSAEVGEWAANNALERGGFAARRAGGCLLPAAAARLTWEVTREVACLTAFSCCYCRASRPAHQAGAEREQDRVAQAASLRCWREPGLRVFE